MVVHVPVDLHAEELGGEEQALLAVPPRGAVVDGVGGEGARQVLVHADGDADVVGARLDRLGGQLQRGGRGGAAVVDVHERDAGDADQPDDGVGVVDLAAAAERELHVGPLHAGVGAGGADGVGAHLQRRLGTEPAERVQPDSDDGDVVHDRQSPWVGRKA